MTICSKAIAKCLVYFILSTCIFTLVSCGNGGPPILPIIDPDPGIIVTPGSAPVVVFRITDSCNDGGNINYRFYSHDRWLDGNTVAGESASGVWPSAGRVYVTRGFGQRSEHNLSCTAGKGVCVGATPSNNQQIYWGVGIDGDQSCASCCVRCPTSGRSIFLGGNLTC